MKNSIKISENTKNRTSYNPAMLLLGMYPKENKLAYQTDICPPMFIISLFTTASIWNQLKNLSLNE